MIFILIVYDTMHIIICFRRWIIYICIIKFEILWYYQKRMPVTEIKLQTYFKGQRSKRLESNNKNMQLNKSIKI